MILKWKLTTSFWQSVDGVELSLLSASVLFGFIPVHSIHKDIAVIDRGTVLEMLLRRILRGTIQIVVPKSGLDWYPALFQIHIIRKQYLASEEVNLNPDYISIIQIYLIQINIQVNVNVIICGRYNLRDV